MDCRENLFRLIETKKPPHSEVVSLFLEENFNSKS